MAKEFKLPELGENIQSADILKVLVKPGDKVEKDQIVLEIETDKATIEVPSEESGTVKEVRVKEGDKASIGSTILVFEEGESSQKEEKPSEEKQETKKEEAKTEEVKKEEKKPEQKEQKSDTKQQTEVKPKSESKGGIIEFKLPELGENIQSADILAVKVKAGDVLEKDQIVIEIETDKATIEVPSDVSGIIKEVLVKDGDKAKIGQTILTVESEEAQADAQKKVDEKLESAEKEDNLIDESKIKESETPSQKEEGKKEESQKVYEQKTSQPVKLSTEKEPVDPSKLAPAAPTVRRFAREIGIDINKVTGTGPGGRISIKDVKNYSKEMNQTAKAAPQNQQQFGGGIPSMALPDFKKWGEVEVKEMTNIRRKTAENLSYAWATIPHVTQFDKADVTELEKLRKTYGKKAEESGGKLTVTAILLKIIASALKAFPQFNSSVDMENRSIVYKKYIHIGVAVDTDRGLLVPVIRDVDKKNIIELSVELQEMAEKARNKKLSLDDMQGGCFTITNLGGIGGTYFTPIVNTPEVAILGVSRGSYEQVYIDGKFEPRMMLPFSLSYDHRVIDGADAIKFLRWIVNAIQQPFLLALEG